MNYSDFLPYLGGYQKEPEFVKFFEFGHLSQCAALGLYFVLAQCCAIVQSFQQK
jgi:hypothetical protein